MTDPLSELTLCEDGAERAAITPTTVVFARVWGSDSYARRILPLAEQLSIQSIAVGLADEGIAVTFKNKKEASLMRLFFEGETVIQ